MKEKTAKWVAPDVGPHAALEFCRQKATPEMRREAKAFAELNFADAIELLALIVFNHAQVLGRLEAAAGYVDPEEMAPRAN